MAMPVLQTAALMRSRIELLHGTRGLNPSDSRHTLDVPLVHDSPRLRLERVSQSSSCESSCASSSSSESSTSPRQLQRLVDQVERRASQLQSVLRSSAKGDSSEGLPTDFRADASSLDKAATDARDLRLLLSSLIRVAAASPSRHTRKALKRVARQFAAELGSVCFDPVREIGKALLRPTSPKDGLASPRFFQADPANSSKVASPRRDTLETEDALSEASEISVGEKTPTGFNGPQPENAVSAVVALLDLFNSHRVMNCKLRSADVFAPWEWERELEEFGGIETTREASEAERKGLDWLLKAASCLHAELLEMQKRSALSLRQTVSRVQRRRAVEFDPELPPEYVRALEQAVFSMDLRSLISEQFPEAETAETQAPSSSLATNITSPAQSDLFKANAFPKNKSAPLKPPQALVTKPKSLPAASASKTQSASAVCSIQIKKTQAPLPTPSASVPKINVSTPKTAKCKEVCATSPTALLPKSLSDMTLQKQAASSSKGHSPVALPPKAGVAAVLPKVAPKPIAPKTFGAKPSKPEALRPKPAPKLPIGMLRKAAPTKQSGA